MAQGVVERAGLQADVLVLSLVTSEYGRNIHPCKGCVSSAMPLCDRPCSCNPNHALDKEKAVQDGTRNVARSLVQAVKEFRAGRLSQPDKQVKWPRAK
jgi:hypothetical protein